MQLLIIFHMKKSIIFSSLVSLFLLILFSCSTEDNSSNSSNYNVYKNKTGDVNANALHAQYIAPNNEHIINIYGLFDLNNNPTIINTITYQKTNSDTLVNMVINPITNRINSLFTSVNGIKSNIVMKFNYLSNNDVDVSFYQYDWNNNTSQNIYTTRIINTNLNGGRSSLNSPLNDVGYNLAALGIGIASAEMVAVIGGGFSGIGYLSGAAAVIVAGTSAVAIVGAAAIVATIFFINEVGAATVEPSDMSPLANTEIFNPVPPENDPTPNLQQTSCFNNDITFNGTMDSLGNIAISAVNGGISPYTYMVENEIQQNEFFLNEYSNESYLLGVKDANGCMSVKVIPLERGSAGTSVTDIDGNVYNTVTIGSQVWMQSNLNVSKYRNGDPIPQVAPDQLEGLTTGAWCYYENSTAYGTTYGKLYNWYAVKDPRGLAPQGFHIPTKSEWTFLTNFLGGNGVAGGKMKSITGWNSPNEATNSSGFTGLPGGNVQDCSFCGDDYAYSFFIGDSGYWWSSSERDDWSAWCLNLNNSDAYAFTTDYHSKDIAVSVRCVKD